MEIDADDGTATGAGEGVDGDGDDEDGKDEEGNKGPGEDDEVDPNAGKTAEERSAARRRKKGAATDESKPKEKKKGAGAGAGVAGAADEDGADDDADGAENAGDDDAEGDLVPGGRADIGEETRVTLQMLEDTTLDDDGEDDEGGDKAAKAAAAAELTPEEVEAARAAAAVSLAEWRERSGGGAGSGVRAQELWRRLELLTGALSGELAEQLRLILEPTLASRLQGDFRTGKRLNMRKIIPYIASDFRKDKIWLRRSRPSQRKYQVVLAIDDSKSMVRSGLYKLGRA